MGCWTGKCRLSLWGLAMVCLAAMLIQSAPVWGAPPNAPAGKTIIQGNIVYSDGSPVVGKRFTLGEVDPKTGQISFRRNADGSLGIASGVTDGQGFLKIEVDSEEFKEPEKLYSLTSYPRNNTQRTPYGIVGSSGLIWLKITAPNELFDLSKIGRIVYAFPKAFDDPSAKADIPLLNAAVDNIRFFESGSGFPTAAERVYKKKFARSESHFINWELNLKYPNPGKRVDFAIEAVWKRLDGSIVARQTVNTFVEAKWEVSWHCGGWGDKTVNFWQPGVYMVEIYIEGKPVMVDSFTVY